MKKVLSCNSAIYTYKNHLSVYKHRYINSINHLETTNRRVAAALVFQHILNPKRKRDRLLRFDVQVKAVSLYVSDEKELKKMILSQQIEYVLGDDYELTEKDLLDFSSDDSPLGIVTEFIARSSKLMICFQGDDFGFPLVFSKNKVFDPQFNKRGAVPISVDNVLLQVFSQEWSKQIKSVLVYRSK